MLVFFSARGLELDTVKYPMAADDNGEKNVGKDKKKRTRHGWFSSWVLCFFFIVSEGVMFFFYRE